MGIAEDLHMLMPLKCMFDTNVFNRILDGELRIAEIADRMKAYTTHIQRDEISNTKNDERRTALLKTFEEVIFGSEPTESFVVGTSRIGEARLGGGQSVPTSSAVWGVSRWGKANWGREDNLYSTIKAELDQLNRSKPNNIQDALIAETSIKNNLVLITTDSDLSTVTKRYGGTCLSVEELWKRCTDS